MADKIVVAYSGGLDTSVMVKWLSLKHDGEIIAVCGDLGQKDELTGLEEKALKTGASAEEIHHTVIMALPTIGLPSTMAAFSWVDDILEDKKE